MTCAASAPRPSKPWSSSTSPTKDRRSKPAPTSSTTASASSAPPAHSVGAATRATRTAAIRDPSSQSAKRVTGTTIRPAERTAKTTLATNTRPPVNASTCGSKEVWWSRGTSGGAIRISSLHETGREHEPGRAAEQREHEPFDRDLPDRVGARPAPRARRTENSRARPAPWVSSSSEMFTVAITETRPTAAISTHNTRLDAADHLLLERPHDRVSGPRPLRHRRGRVRPSAITASTVVPRAASGRSPGAACPLEPPDDSSTGTQKAVSGEGKSNPSGITPTTRWETPSRVTSEPMVDGGAVEVAPPGRVAQDHLAHVTIAAASNVLAG